MKASFICITLLILTACESDESKHDRLAGDQAVNCILADKYSREYEMVALQSKTPLKDSLTRLASEYRTKCDLSTREYNRFMR